MKKIYSILISTILLTTAFAVGEAGAIFLLIAPGAGPAGTGEAQVALSDDVYASYYNPAGLGFQSGKEVAGMHVNWLPNLADDLYYEFIAYKYNIPNLGTIGAHIIFLNLGEQMQTDHLGAELGLFRSSMWAITGSFGTDLSASSAIGISAKIIHQNLAPTGAGSEITVGASTDFAFDLGYLKKWSNTNFGLAITNIGPKIWFMDEAQADPAPTNMRLGFYSTVFNDGFNKINVLVDANKLLVSRYQAMDWDGNGVISGENEIAHIDSWYKAIITSWLDDWYYGGDYDYNQDFIIGGYQWIDSDYTCEPGFYNYYTSSSTSCNSGTTDEIDVNLSEPWIDSKNNNYDFGEEFDDYGLDNIMKIDYNNDGDYGDRTFIDNVWKYDIAPDFGENNGQWDWFWNDWGEDGLYAFDFNNDGLYEDYCKTDHTHVHDTEEDCLDESNWIYDNNGIEMNGTEIIHSWNEEIAPDFGENDGIIDENDLDWGQEIYTDSKNGYWDDELIITDPAGNIITIPAEDFQDWDDDNEFDNNIELQPNFDLVSFNDSDYGKYNNEGEIEVGSGDDRTFSTELKEMVYNLGIEYWYTENFVLRGGYIFDQEGKITNPTFGAGIRFAQYGFDFGYTAGEQGHPRANTMFFSINMSM